MTRFIDFKTIHDKVIFINPYAVEVLVAGLRGTEIHLHNCQSFEVHEKPGAVAQALRMAMNDL